MSRFTVNGNAGTGDPENQFYRQHKGLIKKSFVSEPAGPDSKYQDSLFYLPFVPTLDVKAKSEQMKFAPPKAVNGGLEPIMVYDIGGHYIHNSEVKVPWDLKFVPVDPSGDNSLERCIRQGRYNWDEDKGRPRRIKKYVLLMYRVDGDGLPEPTAMHLGPKQMSELCSQLQTHKKYVKNLVGVPMKILRSDDGALFIDIDTDTDRLDVKAMPLTTADGDYVLDVYLDALRETFEVWLSENGWTFTMVDGRRVDWRADTSVPSTPPWLPTTEAEPERETVLDLLNDSGIEYDPDGTVDELRAIAAGAGLL